MKGVGRVIFTIPFHIYVNNVTFSKHVLKVMKTHSKGDISETFT